MPESLQIALNYFIETVMTTLAQLFILLGPGLLLAFIMYFITQWERDLGGRVFNWKIWVYGTFLGTVVHELGHAIAAILFGHRIVDIKLFDPDPESGMLGYVKHAYNPNNLYQRVGNFFIGIGPVIFGPLVIYLALLGLVGWDVFAPLQTVKLGTLSFTSLESLRVLLEQVANGSLGMFQAMFTPDHLSGWQFYVFLYLAASIGSHVQLSPPDIKGAASGFLLLVGLVFLFNLITLWIGNFAARYISAISQSYSFFYGVLLFTIVLNLALLVLFAVLFALRSLVGR